VSETNTNEKYATRRTPIDVNAADFSRFTGFESRPAEAKKREARIKRKPPSCGRGTRCDRLCAERRQRDEPSFDWCQPTPERCMEAFHLQRTRFELIVERKLRRRQLTDDDNIETTGRDLRERTPLVGQRDFFDRSGSSRA
jgi:hypothetical protein